jgi:hypothetical protein
MTGRSAWRLLPWDPLCSDLFVRCNTTINRFHSVIIFMKHLNLVQFSMESLLVTDDFSFVCQHEEHSLLVCWMVVWINIWTETNVSHYAVHYMVQGVIPSSINSDVQERMWSGCSGAFCLDCPRSPVFLIRMARSWTFHQHVQSLPRRS